MVQVVGCLIFLLSLGSLLGQEQESECNHHSPKVSQISSNLILKLKWVSVRFLV